jgi:hypothetical protein
MVHFFQSRLNIRVCLARAEQLKLDLYKSPF